MDSRLTKVEGLAIKESALKTIRDNAKDAKATADKVKRISGTTRLRLTSSSTRSDANVPRPPRRLLRGELGSGASVALPQRARPEWNALRWSL